LYRFYHPNHGPGPAPQKNAPASNFDSRKQLQDAGYGAKGNNTTPATLTNRKIFSEFPTLAVENTAQALREAFSLRFLLAGPGTLGNVCLALWRTGLAGEAAPGTPKPNKKGNHEAIFGDVRAGAASGGGRAADRLGLE
jgi:hypothetical protein